MTDDHPKNFTVQATTAAYVTASSVFAFIAAFSPRQRGAIGRGVLWMIAACAFGFALYFAPIVTAVIAGAFYIMWVLDRLIPAVKVFLREAIAEGVKEALSNQGRSDDAPE